MAHKNRQNAQLPNQLALPPIRRICNIAQDPISLSSDDGNSPLRFLRLPRLAMRPNVKSHTPPSLHKTEQKNESYKFYVAIDENFPPLQTAAKQGMCSPERWKYSKETKRQEKTNVHTGAHRTATICRESDSPKNAITQDKAIAAKTLRRPVHLLRRRLKPCKAYQHADCQMSYDELLSFEQNMDQLGAFTERDKMMELRDFNGEKIDLKNTDITSYIATFEVQRKANGNKRASMEKTSPEEETDVRVRERFSEALDQHFYYYYRNTYSERRMAICEEIERRIVVDDLALTCFREHLSLTADMNTWML